MVIDPEHIYSETKPELDYDKIRVIYNTHKINIYVIFINISPVNILILGKILSIKEIYHIDSL